MAYLELVDYVPPRRIAAPAASERRAQPAEAAAS
jgi:hypothetical protein